MSDCSSETFSWPIYSDQESRPKRKLKNKLEVVIDGVDRVLSAQILACGHHLRGRKKKIPSWESPEARWSAQAVALRTLCSYVHKICITYFA